MTSSKFILFLGFVTLAACASDLDDYSCKWSDCEDMDMSNDDVCTNIGFNVFSSQTARPGCPTNTTKRLCCTPIPSVRGECKWTNSCYTSSMPPKNACEMEFNLSLRGKMAPCQNDLVRYECCR
ncbi:hypothetical protein Bhyg_09024, partial [Pseudolycoriella hygida]